MCTCLRIKLPALTVVVQFNISECTSSLMSTVILRRPHININSKKCISASLLFNARLMEILSLLYPDVCIWPRSVQYVFSRGRREGDWDGGSKQLIERDKIDVECSGCALVMNVSNKLCICGIVKEEPYAYDAERKGRALLVLLLWSICCYVVCIFVCVSMTCAYT